MIVSKFVTTELCFSRMTNRHGHWAFWMSMGGKSSLLISTHNSSMEHVVETETSVLGYPSRLT